MWVDKRSNCSAQNWITWQSYSYRQWQKTEGIGYIADRKKSHMKIGLIRRLLTEFIALEAFMIKGEFKIQLDIKDLLSLLPRNILRNIRKLNTSREISRVLKENKVQTTWEFLLNSWQGIRKSKTSFEIDSYLNKIGKALKT